MADGTEIRALHDRAVEAGKSRYRDPETGFAVLTELGHRRRGACCGCGCRHCPWGHEAMSIPDRIALAKRPTFLHGAADEATDTVLFWSGGKDSLLALEALETASLTLLTTFDPRRRAVAQQEIPLEDIVAQATALDLPLLGVPLDGRPYVEVVDEALGLLPGARTLVFGDLHLVSIRDWREAAFGSRYTLRFPLWEQPAAALLDAFEATGARAAISAVADARLSGRVQVGEAFDRAFVGRLPEGIDPFGENGEFHTRLEPRSLRQRG
jgi:diphthamide synthase (EF-2-diphthine--ammonia ligase)